MQSFAQKIVNELKEAHSQGITAEEAYLNFACGVLNDARQAAVNEYKEVIAQKEDVSQLTELMTQVYPIVVLLEAKTGTPGISFNEITEARLQFETFQEGFLRISIKIFREPWMKGALALTSWKP